MTRANPIYRVSNPPTTHLDAGHLQKLGSERLDLLLDGGARVKGPDDGAHVLRRANGRQTGHAPANHQHFGRRNFTRCGDLTWRKGKTKGGLVF